MGELLISNVKIWTLGNRGTIENGWLTVDGGIIKELGEGAPPEGLEFAEHIDGEGRHLLPGLVDCHTHLMEYATSEVHNTRADGQEMAAVANLLTAMKCGIVATGEHHLGHPILSMPMEKYREILANIPMKSAMAFGCCWLGFEPKVLTSCTRPGQAFTEDKLTDKEYEKMAEYSDFAGENLFLNYTCANAPLEAVPHAGGVTYGEDKLRRIVDIFHQKGKAVGAHIEGDDSARLFMACGGDVIHHGHNITPETGALMAEKGVSLVVTPSAGTSKRPTSPPEAYGFYRQGVFMALASDSYIPPHKEADWIPFERERMAGPGEFMAICGSTLRYLVEQGVSRPEALRLITVNARKIIHPSEPEAILAPKRPADMILCDKLPALETEDPKDVAMVIIGGKVQVSRLG